MKNTACFLFIVLALSGSAQVKFAHPGPKGIFVYLGKQIPNGVKIAAITVYRKDDKSDFKAVADVKCAASELEFMAKAKDAAKYFPDVSFPPDSQLKTVWTRAAKYGLLDSATYWAMHPAVRMALGLLYYDLSAKENIKYTYKINDNTSSEVYFPYYPRFDDVKLSEYQYDKNGLLIKFKSVGKNAPASFKVFKYNDAGKTEEVTGYRTMYKVRDTAYYLVLDNKVTPGKQYQYSWVGVDQHGNTSYGSSPVFIHIKDFQKVYFAYTKATREPQYLGMRLSWRLSDVSAIQSISVFRSATFDGEYKLLTTVRGQDTTFIDEEIAPDKIYYYYLQATDNTGAQTLRSGRFFDYGLDPGKPITPIIQHAVPLPNGVKLELAIPDEFIAGYRVYRSENNNPRFVVIADMVPIHPDSNSAVYYDTSANMSGRFFYNYRIESISTSNVVSDLSNTVQCRPFKSAEVPAPAYLHAYFQDSAIHLFWSDMQREDELVAGYRIYKKESGAPEFVSLLPKDSLYEGNRFTDFAYRPGKTYEYEIESVDLQGFPGKGRATAKVEVPAEPILPPSNIIARNLPDGILIEWSKPLVSGLKHFKLYRYQRGKEPVVIAQPDAGSVSYLDKTAKAGELYFYMLSSVHVDGTESVTGDEVGVRH
ncbi:MAG: hypothetical protein RML37_10310 [Chitinophagales bacterium]|nr:hypothetical protein [Chitinophagales bacterium]